MFNDKIINNILLIIILILLANYFSNNKLIIIIKNFLQKMLYFFSNQNENFTGTVFDGKLYNGINQCSNTTPNIVHDNDFYEIYNSNDPNMRKLYYFLQSLITNNNHYDLTQSTGKPIKMNSGEKENLTKFILKSLNCNDIKFLNLVILDSILYYKNPKGIEIKPFRINTDIYINKQPIGKFTFHIEMFNRLDTTFYGPIRSGFPTFTRIKIINKDKIANITDIDNPSMNNSMNNSNVNSENSLIPDSIDLSTNNNSDRSDATNQSY
jgi:hypothetical protein